MISKKKLYATVPTPHNSYYVYVNSENKKACDFLRIISIWGNYDHEHNDFVSFEIPVTIVTQTCDILELHFDLQRRQGILNP